MDGILTSIKKLLGVSEEYDQFDMDIIIHINTAISKLTQIGVGPSEGFFIEDETSTWSDFISDSIRLESVKTYIYLNVKLMFDPPNNSSLVDPITRAINELEWRLNVIAES